MYVSAMCLVDVSRYVDARAQFGETCKEGFTPHQLTIPGAVKDAESGAVGETTNVKWTGSEGWIDESEAMAYRISVLGNFAKSPGVMCGISRGKGVEEMKCRRTGCLFPSFIIEGPIKECRGPLV